MAGAFRGRNGWMSSYVRVRVCPLIRKPCPRILSPCGMFSVREGHGTSVYGEPLSRLDQAQRLESTSADSSGFALEPYN